MACFQDGGESPVNCAWSVLPSHLERIKPLRLLINYSRASFVQPEAILCVYTEGVGVKKHNLSVGELLSSA